MFKVPDQEGTLPLQGRDGKVDIMTSLEGIVYHLPLPA